MVDKTKSVTADELLTKFHKQYGENVGGWDFAFEEAGRIPTGVFGFDVATGGGIPKGRITLVSGKESSLKTGLVLRTVAQFQRLYPDQTVVFVDQEGSTTKDWATKMGVDTSRWIYHQPEYAEQGVDMFVAYLYAKDVGMLCYDSIAAMATMQELKSSAEGATPGTQPRLVGEFVRKTVQGLIAARSEGREPTVLWINQLRMKIGVLFGNPETLPGGMAQMYAACLRVRLYGKNVERKDVSKVLPVRKNITGVIQKWKVPIIGTHFDYEMAMVPHDGLRVGECDEVTMVLGYLKDLNLIEKQKNGSYTTVFGPTFPTLKALVAWFKAPEVMDQIRERVIADLSSFQQMHNVDPTGVGV